MYGIELVIQALYIELVTIQDLTIQALYGIELVELLTIQPLCGIELVTIQALYGIELVTIQDLYGIELVTIQHLYGIELVTIQPVRYISDLY